MASATLVRLGLVATVCLVQVVGLGCGTSVTIGSGSVVTTSVPVSSFNRIEVSSGFDVDVSLGGSEDVTVRVDDNLVERLEVEVAESTLRIALAADANVRDATLHAAVTVPTLSSIEGDGGVSVQLADELAGDELELGLSGSSVLDAAVDAGDVELRLAGSSSATLSGRASALVIEGAGTSVLEAEGLQVEDLEIELSGASQARVSVSATISAVLSGGSALEYRGTAVVVRQDVTGGSTITQR
jgi:hypothetical protein